MGQGDEREQGPGVRRRRLRGPHKSPDATLPSVELFSPDDDNTSDVMGEVKCLPKQCEDESLVAGFGRTGRRKRLCAPQESPNDNLPPGDTCTELFPDDEEHDDSNGVESVEVVLSSEGPSPDSDTVGLGGRPFIVSDDNISDEGITDSDHDDADTSSASSDELPGKSARRGRSVAVDHIAMRPQFVESMWTASEGDAFVSYVEYFCKRLLWPDSSARQEASRTNSCEAAIRRIRSLLKEHQSQCLSQLGTATKPLMLSLIRYPTLSIARLSSSQLSSSVDGKAEERCAACNRKVKRQCYKVTLTGRQYNPDELWDGKIQTWLNAHNLSCRQLWDINSCEEADTCRSDNESLEDEVEVISADSDSSEETADVKVKRKLIISGNTCLTNVRRWHEFQHLHSNNLLKMFRSLRSKLQSERALANAAADAAIEGAIEERAVKRVCERLPRKLQDDFESLKCDWERQHEEIDESQTPIYFGKHRGRKFQDVSSSDPAYCHWVAGLPNPTGQMKEFADYLNRP